MKLSFRNSNYKATLSQPTTNQHVIDNLIPNNLLTSNHPILKCVTSKAIIRLLLAADNSYDDGYRNNEELTEFDRDDEELTILSEGDEELTMFDEDVEFVEDDEDNEEFTEFVEDGEEFIIFNEEDFTPHENTENPVCSTVLNGENTAPNPVLTSHDEPTADGENKATTSFCWQNPDKVSSSCFQQCSYWGKVPRERSFRNTMV